MNPTAYLIYTIILCGLFIITLATFMYMMIIEKRTILIGINFLFLGILSMLLIIRIEMYLNEQQRIALYLLVSIIIILVALFPLAVIGSLIYSSIQMIRKEGFSLRNLLSLALLVSGILYYTQLPMLIAKYQDNGILYFIDRQLMVIISYFIMTSIIYGVSSFLNYINIFPRKLYYVVVLGAGLLEENVTPLLASRIKKGIKIYRKQRKRKVDCKLIMSGGQGDDEVISEAEAMQKFALQQGVPKEDIILENRSTDTYENLKFSVQLMKQNVRFAVVTNYYHLFRALLIAKSLNLNCIGYGAKTKWYYSVNEFVREYVAYLILKRKNHLVGLLGLSTIYWLFVFVRQIIAIL